MLALALLALPSLFDLRVDNALEVWLDEDSAAHAEYQEFLHIFGSEEFILLLYELPEPLDLALLERLTDLQYDLEEIDGVRQTYGIASLFSRFFSLRGLEAFEVDLRRSPFYRHFLISGDGRRAAQWIWLDVDDPQQRRRIVEQVEAVAARSELADARLAGSPVLSVELDRASQHSARLLFPWVFGLSALLLLVLFRRLYGILVPFIAVGTGIVWTFALLVVTGHTLNMVTVALAPLVWVLGLSTSIHLVSRCEQLRAEGASFEEARSETLHQLLRPCVYSALTTALGFGSLLVSSMKPVREMGLFAALGVLLCLLGNLLLFPVLARLITPRAQNGERIWERSLERFLNLLADWTRLHPRRILTGLCLLVLLLGWGVTRLRAEASVIEFFKPDSEIIQVYKQILPDFTGPYSLEILLEPPDLERDTFVALDRLGREIETVDGVERVLSSAELLKKVYQMAEALPPETDLLPAAGDGFERSREQLASRLADEQANFEDAASGAVRLSVLTGAMSSEAHSELVEGLEQRLSVVDPSWNPRLTGIVKLLVGLQHELVESQIRSFGLAFLIIGPVMLVLLRSRRDALTSLVPNLFPIVCVLGTMGWLGIALDPATVMIAGIAFGIAVDDTIHFLVHYRAARQRGEALVDALHTTFHTAGRAMVLTTVVAALGFFVLALADFVPLIHFGVLSGLTMFAALFGNLLFLPALLGLFDE